jgi:hypothetical protein
MLAAFHHRSVPVDLWVGPHDVADRLTNGSADVALMEWWMITGCLHSWRKEPLPNCLTRSAPGQPSAIEASEQSARPWAVSPGRNSAPEEEFGQLGDVTAAPAGSATEAVKRAVRAGRGTLVFAATVADDMNRDSCRCRRPNNCHELKSSRRSGTRAHPRRAVAHVAGERPTLDRA